MASSELEVIQDMAPIHAPMSPPHQPPSPAQQPEHMFASTAMQALLPTPGATRVQCPERMKAPLDAPLRITLSQSISICLPTTTTFKLRT
ncbi:hypothetical protein HBH58_213110 [Parastagonospora nodorum]|nr:hypothetical protein HBH58_213110 [Parastagonospora nodorum]KAH5340833.1 hypothetical protein HBI33_240170 [Parastagonospora nodorum]